MNDLLRIAGLWRRRWPSLALGAAVTLAALAAQLVLSAGAGRLVAGLAAGSVLAVAGPARIVLRYGERLSTHDALFRAIADLRTWFYARFAARSAGGLGFSRGADILSRLVVDIGALDGLYIRVALPALAALLLVPVLLVAGAAVGLWAALAVTLLFGVAALLLPNFTAGAVVRRSAGLAAARAALRVEALDGLAGLREVRAFAAEGRVLQRLQGREAAMLTEERAMAATVSRLGAATLVLGQAALVVALASVHAGVAAGLTLVFLLVPALELAGSLGQAGVAAGLARSAARRTLETADAPPPVPDPVGPAPAPPGTSLTFEAVRFGWAPGRPVLDGLTLDIPQGARVALLGESGAGKSTLAALAMRIAAPQSGRVVLGGVDVAAWEPAALRSRIGWLSQATHLFDDSIAGNLRLADPDADDAALWGALDAAQLGAFVRGLPDQLDTWIGEGGARLSGGQGRRLALARTLLTAAPILLLDEPAAGLDIETERAFLVTLNQAAEGRTVVLIVHRLLGIERLDRIYRLQSGRAIAAAG